MPSLTCLLLAFWLLCRMLDEARPRLGRRRRRAGGPGGAVPRECGLVRRRRPGRGDAGGSRPPSAPCPGGPASRAALPTYGGAWAATVGAAVPAGRDAGPAPALAAQTSGTGCPSYAELGWWWSFNIPHNLRLDLTPSATPRSPSRRASRGRSPLARRLPLDVRLLYFGALAGWLVAVYAFFAALPLLWRSHHRRILIVCVVWTVLYAAFFTVWSPGYFVFWVPVLVPTGLLLALGMSHYRAGRSGVLVNWLVGALDRAVCDRQLDRQHPAPPSARRRARSSASPPTSKAHTAARRRRPAGRRGQPGAVRGGHPLFRGPGRGLAAHAADARPQRQGGRPGRGAGADGAGLGLRPRRLRSG